MKFKQNVFFDGRDGIRYDLSTYVGAAQYTLDAFAGVCESEGEYSEVDLFRMSAQEMLSKFCPDFIFDDDDFGLEADDLLPYIEAEMQKMRDRLTGRGGQAIELRDYAGQEVDELLLEKALDLFVSLEPDPKSPSAEEEFKAALEAHEVEIEKAKAIVRKYGEQITPLNLARMQEVYYQITKSGKYGSDLLRCSIAGSVLSSAWDGVGGWRK